MSKLAQNDLPATILYIEDVEANVKVVRAILKSQAPGCRLSVANSAEQGLDMVLAQPPDLILMDINLPDMDGLEATRRLKRNPDTEAIPVIALTADAMPQQIELADNIGFAAYITKPLDVTSFLQILSTVHLARKKS